MRSGVILVNAYSNLKSGANQAQRLKDEFEKLGVSIKILRNDFFGAKIEGGNLFNALQGFDFCVYLDKDKYVSQVLEKNGLRLFNRHSAIQVCDDKAVTAIALANHGIKMPKTLAGLLCYDEGAEIPQRALEKIESELSYPVIIKECYGSLGKGVFKADNREELSVLAQQLKCRPHLFQQCIKESLGRDVRVIVIGGRVVAAMERQSNGDFRSNIELGGKGNKINTPPDMVELCVKTAEILGLDYCGIDLLLGKDGYYVCEVNSNAFFGGIEAVTGVNVAHAYAEHIFKEIYG